MSLLPARWLHALGLALLLCAASRAAGPSDLIELREARFQRDTDTAEQLVSLPDTWAQRGLPQRAGTAHYRMRLDLEVAPTAMWALRIDRLSPVHRVTLNGQVLDEAGRLDDSSLRPNGHPDLLLVPPVLLHAGSNELELELRVGPRLAGLSTLQAGPASELVPAFERHRGVAETLPKMLNVAGAALAAFMLLIWWRRRRETAIGWFGALWLLASVRDYGHYLPASASPLPSDINAWLYFAVQNASTAMVGLFAIALSGRAWPRARLLFLTAGIGLPLVGACAVAAGQFDLLRTLTYPLLEPVVLTALWVLWTAVRHLHGRALAGLFLGLIAVIGAGVHDYAYLDGWLSVTDCFWLPWAVPPAFACFALALVGRLVTAMDQAEDLTLRLEARVAERTGQLALANQAKARFLAAASHDLRQPVVAIGLLVGLAREQAAALPPLRAMLDRIGAAVASMEALLKGLMDLSRLDVDTLKPRLQVVPLAPLFDAIDLHEQASAVLKDVRLHFRAQRLAVLSDPVLLDQIVRNLVSNAVRYTQRGGVLVSARRRGADTVLLQVWDTGRGIAEAAQDLVFEEFVQLDNPGRDRSKGLGLGLAIVQRSARLLGVHVRLRSVPGRGSCFALELPLALHDAAVPAPAPAPVQALHGLSVWLIEDDADVRAAMSARLQHWGAHVTALAGQAAVQRQLDAAAELPALIVSDQRLADGSGLACIALIRHHAQHMLPAVVVTGDTTPVDLALLASAGLPVLHKPFGADVLLALLQQALGSVATRS